jgi:hypothetical protein
LTWQSVPFAAIKQPASGVLADARHYFLGKHSPHWYNGDMKDSQRLIYAYLAGAIDADGFITIARSSRSKGEKYAHRPTYYNAKIGFTETSPIIPNLLKETFGGSQFEHQPKNPEHKRWYSWQIQNRKAAESLKLLLPYLRLKQEQARLVLEFLELCAEQRSREMKLGITPEVVEKRREYWEHVTRLNAPRNRRVHFVTPADGS